MFVLVAFQIYILLLYFMFLVLELLSLGGHWTAFTSLFCDIVRVNMNYIICLCNYICPVSSLITRLIFAFIFFRWIQDSQ